MVKQRIIVLAALCLIGVLLGLLSGCGGQPPEVPQETSVDRETEPAKADVTNGVIQDMRIGAAGPFFYVPGTGRSTAVQKYNTVTHRVSRACPDADCDGKGLLDDYNIIVTYMSADGIQYYGVIPLLQGDGDTIHLIAQDIETGKITEITTLSSAEQLPRSDVQVYDGQLYYMRKLLRSGGDRTDPDDYEPVIVRRPVQGGSEATVLRLSEDEGLRYVVKEGMILLTAQGVSLVDPETGSRRDYPLTEAQKAEWDIAGTAGIHSCAYRNGILYFRVAALTPLDVPEEDRLVESGPTGDYILSLDLTAGTYRRLMDKQVYSMYLSDEGIYFVPTEQRYLYVPENLTDENRDQIVMTSFSGVLCRCDFDGRNEKEVYRNDKLSFADPYYFAVVDGQLYGPVSEYNEKTHRFTEHARFAQIDLKTGEIIEFTGEGA